MIVNQAALAGIFKSFKTLFNEAWDMAAVQLWANVAMEVPSSAREEAYPWLGDLPQMREWIGDRAVKSLKAGQYSIVNKDYEVTIEVDRTDLEDDRVGIYQPRIRMLADSARRHPDQLVFAALAAGFDTVCYDGQYFFDDDHPVGGTEGRAATTVSNYGSGSSTPWYLMALDRPMKPLILQVRKRPEFVAMDRPDDEEVFNRKKYRYGVDDRKNVGYGLWQLAYGSKEALTAANYATARAAMMSQKNDEGMPLGIVPTHLVVPPALEEDALKILNAETVISGATPITNVWRGSAKLLMVPQLA